MRMLEAAGLSFVLACLALASPASAAGKYDGSAPMLCAVTAMSECEANGQCQRSAPQANNNLPTFLRVDVKARSVSANDGSGRKTEIKASTVVDGHLMLQGIENGKAWNMVIGSETGKWGGSIVEDDGSFAVFGACTLP
ncbi:MAG TPA: hypothetical protein VNQ15_08185 [Verrucomicrobiae bacterium]|nr:hypothetical protein [Verrucomicrobiae bacterium]